MTRIPISFNEASLSALQVLALQEHRNIRQQVAWMIEQELEIDHIKGQGGVKENSRYGVIPHRYAGEKKQGRSRPTPPFDH